MLLVAQIAFTNTYALASAPLLGVSAISELFAELLTTFGLASSSDVDKMTFDDMQSTLDSGIDSVDANSGRSMLDFIMQFQTNSVNQQAKFIDVTSKAFGNWAANAIVNDVKSVVDEYVVDTPTTDNTKGYGSMVKISAGDGSGRYYIYYCDYAEIDTNKKILYIRNYSHRANFEYGYLREWDEQGNQSFNTDSSASSIPGYIGNIYPGYLEYYGDVRYSDGSKAPTNDETEKVIGETPAGDIVTADMVNPVDGSVTSKDGTTVFPKDFLDLSKFTDKAILELLKSLIAAINNAAVADNTLSDDIADDVAVELDVAELNNLTLPSGIASVFPFCLPFDFVRGLQLLASAPVAPKFVIPFEIPSFGLFEGFKKDIVLDFAEYSKYFEVGRWVQTVLFVISLVFISYKLVQGVH